MRTKHILMATAWVLATAVTGFAQNTTTNPPCETDLVDRAWEEVISDGARQMVRAQLLQDSDMRGLGTDALDREVNRRAARQAVEMVRVFTLRDRQMRGQGGAIGPRAAIAPAPALLAKKNNALLNAVAQLDTDKARDLVADGTDPLQPGPDGFSAMELAMAQPDPSLAKAILEGIAEAKSIGLPGMNADEQATWRHLSSAMGVGEELAYDQAFLMAAAEGYGRIASMLMEMEAATTGTVEPVTGNTALHFAAEGERPDVVRFLLSHGADPAALNRKGRTPRDVAPALGESAEILLAGELAEKLFGPRQSLPTDPEASIAVPVAPGPGIADPLPAPEMDDSEILETDDYSVWVPEGWITRDVQFGQLKGKAIISPNEADENGFNESVVIMKDPVLPPGTDSTGYLEMSTPFMESVIAGYTEIAREEVAFGDRLVAQLDFSTNRVGGTSRIRSFFFACEGYGFAMTCTATPESFDSYVDIFQQIAGSFTPAGEVVAPEEDW